MTVINLQSWLPALTYAEGRFRSEQALVCDRNGQLLGAEPADNIDNTHRLRNRAALPGLVNAHSHAFQRVIRGRTEYRTSNATDSFWTWREMMYSASARLTPDDVYDASRMAFLEMALSGITLVGEFHYLHHAPDGTIYADPNLLAKQVVRAARDVGLRIALLRVAYARSGFETEPNPQQARFIEVDPEIYLKHLESLATEVGSVEKDASMAWVGMAPHSVRAVPLHYLQQIIPVANRNGWPVHMHVAEQPAEVSACIAEHGRSPVALLHTEGLLSARFTAVHSVHVTQKAVDMLASSGARVCACPTTERNLGDGIVPVDKFFEQRVPVALGTDSHVEIDLLEDARELEYHLRLQRMERAVLAGPEDQERSAIAARLLDCATENGARSVGASTGKLEPGRPADFFTVDLDDPSVAGATEEDLLSNIVFSLSRTAVKDVVVGGRRIIEDGHHAQQQEIVEKFKKVQKKLWG